MTRTEMHDWFDVIQDKNNQPWFTEAEKDQFINRAQLMFLNEIVYGQLLPEVRGGAKESLPKSAVESNVPSSEVIQPLLVSDIPVTVPVGGKLTDSAINTAMQAYLGDGKTTEKMHVLGISDENGFGCRFVRHNDYRRIKNNSFKKPTDTDPIFRVDYNGVFVERGTAYAGTEGYFVTVLRYPLDVASSSTATTVTECELPEFVHDKIMAIAFEEAGIAARDEALMMLNAKK